MAPRSGGEANKFGHRYEGIWTVRQLLEILYGRAESLTVESTGEEGEGVEFVLMKTPALVEVHQVKRQHGGANSWTIRALAGEGVLEAAERHVRAGREFHFVSVIPSRGLDELSDKARRSDDLEHFVDGQLTNKDLRAEFDLLGSEIWGSPADAWSTLRGIYARWPDERDVRDFNAALTGALLEGASGRLAALALGDLVERNLALTLDSAVVGAKLGDYELKMRSTSRTTELAEKIASLTAAWAAGTGAEMLKPAIERPQAAEIVAALQEGERELLVSGNAGDGKSGILHQVLGTLTGEGWSVLAFRLDRVDPFLSPVELGERLDLGRSPLAALAATADGRPALLLVDQLDAVSLASGRMPGSFGAIAEMLREAEAFPNISVLLACRRFDVENDRRLGELVKGERGAREFAIDPLGDEEVEGALSNMGVDPADLDQGQMALLRSPLHLVLLAAVASDPDGLTFSSTKGLFDRFWENKSRAVRGRRDPPARFDEVIGVLVDSMNSSQRLVAPIGDLDADDLIADAEVLASEHVLSRDGQRIAFFHESFFDYAFARRWVRRDQSLVAFLLGDDQELFKRAQVRQVLNHLHDEDEDRFVKEAREILLCPDIRFHIKDVVLALLGQLTDPSAEEWQAVREVLGRSVAFEERIWGMLRSIGWFDRLFAEGCLSAWLRSSESELQARAVDLMVTGARRRVGEVTELLGELEGDPSFTRILVWVSRAAPIEQSRELFELLLQAVRDGALEDHIEALWGDVHGLGETEPEWAVELLRAFLAERPGALRLGADGRIVDLGPDDRGLLELVEAASQGAPRRFAEELVDYLLAAMAASEVGEGPPIDDRHFGYRIWNVTRGHLDDALLHGMRDALVTSVAADPEGLRETLGKLEGDPHEAAQWLLYEALAAAPAHYAGWAGEILLQGDHRLIAGYSSSPVWSTRLLLEAVGPELSAAPLGELEAMILAFKPSYEQRGYGLSEFTLLSALPGSRLSPTGRRRLGELQRKFERDDPPPPTGITGGTVTSPIPVEAAARMNDEQWLGAIARYSTGERGGGLGLKGDAQELARVLGVETMRDPERFGALLLRFDRATHPAYANAVLRSLGDEEARADATVAFAAMRHVDALGRSENDREMTAALVAHLDTEIPEDILAMILRRALHSPDPEAERWLEVGSDGEPAWGGDPEFFGINTVRGNAARALGDLLIRDADGGRSAYLAPHLAELAQDPSVAVRSCVAQLLAAALRFERPAALAAFELLVEADDRLLATQWVEQLMVYIGRGEATAIVAVIERMLESEFDRVRGAAGRLATFAGLELGVEGILDRARHSGQPQVREGVARVCTQLLAHTTDAQAAGAALRGLFDDPEEEVRSAAATVAMELRDTNLVPHRALLLALVASPAFDPALSQLLITLERATDVEELALATAERFLESQGEAMGNIETAAAGDAREVAELAVRTYVQSSDTAVRSRALDVIDAMLMGQAYGIETLLIESER